MGLARTLGIAAAGLMAAMSGASGAELPRDVSATWASNWSAKKLDAVMRLYAPQPVILPASGERWEGTETIRRNLADQLARFNIDIRLQSRLGAMAGELGYDSGTYDETIVPLKYGKPRHFVGSYLFLFQMQADGEWKILEQSWTESRAGKF
jgi:ketosteroid isomerase-like protein